MSVINTNIKSLIAQDTLTKNSQRLATAMERFRPVNESTGIRRCNRTSNCYSTDAQTRGLQSAIKNAMTLFPR